MNFFKISGLTTFILLFFNATVLAISEKEAIDIAYQQIAETSFGEELMADLISQAIMTIQGLDAEDLEPMSAEQLKTLIINPMIQAINKSESSESNDLALALRIQEEENLQNKTELNQTVESPTHNNDRILALQLQEEENNQTIIEPATKKARTSTLKTAISLPATLKGIPIAHLNAPEKQHGDASCGSRALLTAYAVQRTLQENRPFTSTDLIHYFNEKKSSVYKKDEADDGYLLNINQKLNVTDVFICDQNLNQMSYLHLRDLTNVDNVQDAIHSTISRLHQEPRGSTHFIINTGGHWASLSYVKEQDTKPLFIYIDSVDAPLTDDATATKIIKNLWDQYFNVYYQ